MAILKEIVAKKRGYRLHVIPTDKYKTNTIVWKMKSPLNEENLTLRALLPYVLQNSTKNYPTTAKLRSYLDELYGAMFHVDISKKGEYHILTFTIEIANEKFLQDDTPLLEKAFALLKEVILNPNIEDEQFSISPFNNECRILKQRIEAQADDKMRYANLRLIEEMCKDELYSLNMYGSLTEIDKLTSKQLFDYYKHALATDDLDLYVVGDVDVKDVQQLSAKYLQFAERQQVKVTANEINLKQTPKVYKERQDVKQGKLNIGYRTNILFGDEDYFALQVFNGLFGGFPHSKLFINVREKASLAYYAASRLESHKGLLIVMSGIDNNNFDQAVQIINDQLAALQAGEFSDSEIKQTKAVINNQLLETVDSQRGLIEVFYHNVLRQTNFTIEQWMENITNVTKEDIIEVATKIIPDTIYFLNGVEGKVNENN